MTITIYIATRKRLKRDVDKYAVEIGRLCLAWNEMHERLANILDIILPSKNELDRLSERIWHSQASDLSQRKMLSAAASKSRTLDHDVKIRIKWLVDSIDAFADKRNNAIHAPLLPSNAETHWALAPEFGSSSKRARNLEGKDLLQEFRWYVKYVKELRKFTTRLHIALKSGRPMPEIPILPSRELSRTRGARTRKAPRK